MEMNAAVLVSYGSADQAFEIRKVPKPTPKAGEVQIRVEAFGLNFADVLARKKLYPPAPKPPGILGYEAIGFISELGEGVTEWKVGDRVAALTRFGAYAEYVCTSSNGISLVSQKEDVGKALALTTQGCTAYYSACEVVNLFPEDHVLIHAAAGGVGSLLVQLALHRKCIVYGTASTKEKLTYLQELGVHFPINYRENDFAQTIRTLRGKAGLDVIFDSVGGKTFNDGLDLLSAGGRIVTFGAASLSSAPNIFARLWRFRQFGTYHPMKLIGRSRSIIGVNLLALSDNRPSTAQRVLKETIEAGAKGILTPNIGGIFPVSQLAEAHENLEKRKTMGKIVIKW